MSAEARAAMRKKLADAETERDALAARLWAVSDLHRPWYEVNGVRHELRVIVGWDDAPADHVCVAAAPGRWDSCSDGEDHAVLACSECRGVYDDTDAVGHPFWPCATVVALTKDGDQ